MANILLTGGAGFIGHHLAQHILKTTDHNIVIVDRLDISGTMQRIDDVIACCPDARSRLKFIWHDLKAEINEFVARDIGPIDYIYHLAAGSHVDRSITEPMSFVMDNVVGTGHLLEYARLYLKDKLKFLLYFSTDEVFGSAPEDVDFKEWDRYNSGNPYSASKAGAEELCVAYANTFKMPIHVTHTMNVVGIRQHPEKYIPLVIGKVLDDETIYIHSHPDKKKAGTRFYIDVRDVCDAVMFITDHCVKDAPFPLQKFNIVGKEEIDNLSIALRIAEIMDMNIKYSMVDFHTARPGHDLRYALCGEKMKSMGWEPESINDRLVDIVDWYLKPENSKWLFTNKRRQ
jgi:dTDP-glucose 4,6-dehydratase